MGLSTGTYRPDKDGLGPEDRGEEIQQWVVFSPHCLLRCYCMSQKELSNAVLGYDRVVVRIKKFHIYFDSFL